MRSICRPTALVSFVVFAAFVGPCPALAQDGMTAQQIVDETLKHNAFGFDNAVAKVSLVLTSKRGTERRRDIEIRSASKNGKGKSLVRFHSPADVAGTGFLV